MRNKFQRLAEAKRNGSIMQNKFKGSCQCCGRKVEAKAGYLRHRKVECASCHARVQAVVVVTDMFGCDEDRAIDAWRMRRRGW